MVEIRHFDPFNNRLCRNVRNALSEAFGQALEQKGMQPVERIAGYFLNDPLPVCVQSYIDARLDAFAKVVAHVDRHRLDDPMAVAVAMWNQGLFFETHEFLEPYWIQAQGAEKKFLQAMIRAAGTYVHLEQGNRTGARRISTKALAVLEAQPDRLAAYTSPSLLLSALKRLDPTPPLLAVSIDG